MSTLVIPGYSIKRTLGRGGMATVYLAEQDKFEREVALKVMAPALSADAGFRERFLREAKIVAKISHPNIVAVYDVNEVDGIHYIAMEFHPGGDLKARLKAGLTAREALRIAKDVARALDFAHGKGYLHRDIKPDNVLFRADGSAVLTDFGIAKATEGDANLTQMGMIAGTPKYMSPEQARGQPLDADSDLYSLGVVLFEMLAGRLPFEAADPIALGILHMNAPVPRLDGALGHFQPLLDRLLAKQPAQRPQSGAQVIREIEALEQGFDFEAAAKPEEGNTVVRPAMRRPVPVPVATGGDANADLTVMAPAAVAPAQPERTARGFSRRHGMAAALAALLVAGGGGGWWLQQQAEARAQAARVAAEAAATLEAELGAARAALTRNALTAPADDNALLHFRRVLALQPAHPEAMAGLQRIAAALQMQASGALAVGRIDDAERLLGQARDVAPDSTVLTALDQAIAKARLAAQAQPRQQPVAARPPVPARMAAEPVAKTEVAAPDALARLRIRGMLGSARQALDDGDTATAIQQYRQVLQLEPANAEARLGLQRAQSR